MAATEELFALLEDLSGEHPDLSDLFGPVAEDVIAAAEERLGVRLPSSYRRFIGRYGYGGIGSEEFSGLSPREAAGASNTVWSTLKRRQRGMPASLIVVEDLGDDWIYCLDISQEGPDGEAPVVEWIPGATPEHQDLTPRYPGFAEFALTRLREMA